MHVDRQFHRLTRQERPARPADRRAARPWLQLLNAVLDLAGAHAELVRHAEKPWASATFAGSRHTVVLQFAGCDGILAAEAFVEALPDHEFTLAGKLVADATIAAVEQVAGADARATIEAEFLLLDEI